MLWLAFSMVALDFSEWVVLYNKSYTSHSVREQARAIFYENDAFIRNRTTTSLILGHNMFSDVDWQNFRLTQLQTIPSLQKKSPKRFPPSLFMMRDGKDWTTTGAIRPVRQQGQCGSCWAFSAAEAIEGNLFVNSGVEITLSPESLLDCDRVDRACMGGSMESAFKYVMQNGICTEHDEPYRLGRAACECKPSVVIDDYERVNPSVHDLTRALLQTPVSVAIEADQRVFQFYKSGIIDASTCGSNLDHGVLLVGFGYTSNQSYWRIKNSWGTSWGEDGFARIERAENACGILNDASYPVGARAIAVNN